KTRAAAIFVPEDFSQEIVPAAIRVVNPAKSFEQIVRRFAPPPVKFEPGIHPTAVIHATAKVGHDVSIQPYVVIEAGADVGANSAIGSGSYIGHGVAIGEACTIYPHVTVRERC